MKRIGLIGIGFIGVVHAKAIVSSTQGLELAAICGADNQKDREAASQFPCAYYTDAAEMMRRKDIDIIDICTPTFLHEQYVVMAAQAGKDVICEKPFDLTLSAIDNMINCCKANQVRLMVAQVIRFMAEYQTLTQMVRDNTLGEIRTAHFKRMTANAGRIARNVKWYDDPSASGGALFDLHIHDLDYACSILGKPKKVYCVGRKSPSGCWDELFSTITFDGGAEATIEASSYMPEKYPFTVSFRVCGENGCAEYAASSQVNSGASMQQAAFIWYPRKGDAAPISIEPVDGYQKELEYFAHCVANNSEPDLVPVTQSRQVIATTLRIKESLETGKVIVV